MYAITTERILAFNFMIIFKSRSSQKAPAEMEELVKKKKSTSWKRFFSNSERFADVINAIGCQGQQIVKASDLQELDVAEEERERDLLRKSAFGVNFALIGVENQETVDYRLPIRVMDYDVADYRKQLTEIASEVRKSTERLSSGEYLYGFRKKDKVHPVITIVLYAGEEPWNGATSLHEIVDFNEIPEGLRRLTPNYQVNVIDIRRLPDTSIFKTDVGKVFAVIRCLQDREKLKELIATDTYYQEMEQDAFDVITSYANVKNGASVMGNSENGGMNMGNAILEMIEEGRTEGQNETKRKMINAFLKNGGTEEEAIRMLDVTAEDVALARKSVL